MAFTAKMAFSPPKYCRLFAQKKAYQGGSRAPQDPPSYAPANVFSSVKNLTEGSKGVQRYIFRKSGSQSATDCKTAFNV